MQQSKAKQYKKQWKSKEPTFQPPPQLFLTTKLQSRIADRSGGMRGAIESAQGLCPAMRVNPT